jgi:hypothetical protein
MNSLKSTWSPLQSPEVREICAHLTSTEHEQLLQDARQRGRQIFFWLAAPLSFVIAFCLESWRFGRLVIPLFVVYFAVWGLPHLRSMRRRTLELLCQTEWAHNQGYTTDRLRLMTLPWSR